MSCITVTQVTRYDRGMISIIGWSYILQSYITWSYDTKKDIEGSGTNNVI